MPNANETRPPEKLLKRPSTKTRTAVVVAGIGFAGSLVGAIATVLAVYLPIRDKRATTSDNAVPVARAVAPYDWKYEEFIQTGGAGAAARLNQPEEQPVPEDVYATAPAAEKICVWWKPSPGSGFTYQYASIKWDKNHPIATAALPSHSSGYVPIGFGGRNYELFLFFNGTKSK
jgi:hypothetical protein